MIDERFGKLFELGDIDAAQHAISRGDVLVLHAELKKAYGPIHEVICLSGPFNAKSILVFEGGIGLLAGADSYIPILTFGYEGQGAYNFSAFLSAAGFAVSDATKFAPPLIVYSDGSITKGIRQGSDILWEDGNRTRVPKFLDEQ